MFPSEIHFGLYERKNTFRKSGKEWALSVQFAGDSPWVIKTWNKEPCEKTVEDLKDVVLLCFEIYHRGIKIPSFEMDVQSV